MRGPIFKKFKNIAENISLSLSLALSLQLLNITPTVPLTSIFIFMSHLQHTIFCGKLINTVKPLVSCLRTSLENGPAQQCFILCTTQFEVVSNNTLGRHFLNRSSRVQILKVSVSVLAELCFLCFLGF